MTGSIAVSQCGYTPNRPGHHGTVVARTVGTVAISCNAGRVKPRPLTNDPTGNGMDHAIIRIKAIL